MSYKNFEFSFFIQGSQGNDIFNINAINSTLDYGYGLNMPEDVYLDHWTPTHTNAKYPVISRTVTYKVSNRFIEDGSYLRVKNIQLAYNFSGKKLKANWIRNIQLYVSGQNLLTFTKYSWFDPEVNAEGSGNSTSLGYDWYSYPTSKSVTFGIRAGF
jgi:TonB-dependent starch-binding outer membrane protein SusC